MKVEDMKTKKFWSMVGRGTVKGLCVAAKATVKASVVTAKATTKGAKVVGKEFADQYKGV